MRPRIKMKLDNHTLEIFKAIAEEFKERRFVLIFDQFETVGKASTDFFLNFVKFLIQRKI